MWLIAFGCSLFGVLPSARILGVTAKIGNRLLQELVIFLYALNSPLPLDFCTPLRQSSRNATVVQAAMSAKLAFRPVPIEMSDGLTQSG